MTRARGGQLDYVPQAFPGCRAPDGPAPGLEDELVRLGLAHKVPEVVRLALDQLFESIRARVPTATEAHVARFKHAHFAELAVGLEHLVRQALLPADSDRLEGTCACREGAHEAGPRHEMSVADLQAATGCTAEVAADVLARKPGNPKAQLALARLKTPAKQTTVAAREPAPAAPTVPRGYEAAGAARCDCCGRERPLNRIGFCPDCTRRGSRKWNKGRSKFNALPRKTP